MAEKPPLRVSVIGRNVSAALWLEGLSAGLASGTFHLEWHAGTQHQKSDCPLWVLVPTRLRAFLPQHLPVDPMSHVFVFLGRSRRVPLKTFLQEGDPYGTFSIPPILRKKWVALSLFNDMTPSPWKERRLRITSPLRPDPSWMTREPLSLSRYLSPESDFPYILVPRNQVLDHFQRSLAERGVHVAPAGCGVYGIQPKTHREPFYLLHNAPFGTTPADRILWMDMSSVAPVSTSKNRSPTETPLGSRSRDHLPPYAIPYAQWVSRAAWVPLERVAGLPRVSLWLDSQKSKRFLSTGLWTGGTFRRVFCLPPEITGQAGDQAWLQIEELVAADGSLGVSSSTDGFLQDLCPGLREFPRRYAEWRIDEGSVFENPEAISHRMHRHIQLWHPSALGDPVTSAHTWLNQYWRPAKNSSSHVESKA